MSIAIAIGVGLVAGLFAGMLGIGGGIIMIPGMVLLLSVEQHTAQGVSLAVIAVTALVGAITHYRQHNLSPRLVLTMAPAAALFGFLGSEVAHLIDALLLRQIFGSVTIVIGIFMLRGDWPRWWRWATRAKNPPVGEASCQH